MVRSAMLGGVKPWAKAIVIVLALLGVSVWLLLPNNKARRTAERARQTLRKEGFKLAPEEFQLLPPAGLGADDEILTQASENSRSTFSIRRVDLMRPIGSNLAVVSWNQENPVGDIVTDSYWPNLQESLAERNRIFDQACESVIAAPFRFNTLLTTNETAPGVLRARLLALAIAARATTELHDGHHLHAWTNLLALTRLVTGWQTEPMEISHFMRFRWVSMAHRLTWEALQAKDWTDSELARLQQEWELPDFFAGLPETAAFARACTVALSNFQRQKPLPPGPTLREFISRLVDSPNRAWADATAGWRSARYRNRDSYEDETAWLLYFRDCEVDYKRALTATTWSELRALPSATNSLPPRSSDSPFGMDAARITGAGSFGGFQRQGPTLLARAADAEARRRLLIVAIAIERFRLANNRYPDSLARLAPTFIKSVPKDFIDGQPLRFRRTDDGRFLLYSVGIDGIDDHGQLLVEAGQPRSGFGRPEGPDIVWPLPASPTEVRTYAQTMQSQSFPPSDRMLPLESRTGRMRPTFPTSASTRTNTQAFGPRF